MPKWTRHLLKDLHYATACINEHATVRVCTYVHINIKCMKEVYTPHTSSVWFINFLTLEQLIDWILNRVVVAATIGNVMTRYYIFSSKNTFL